MSRSADQLDELASGLHEAGARVLREDIMRRLKAGEAPTAIRADLITGAIGFGGTEGISDGVRVRVLTELQGVLDEELGATA